MTVKVNHLTWLIQAQVTLNDIYELLQYNNSPKNHHLVALTVIPNYKKILLEMCFCPFNGSQLVSMFIV